MLFSVSRGVPQSQPSLVSPGTHSISIPLLAPEDMPAADARTVMDHQREIVRSALIYGYNVDASYRYRQVACPLAPHHLILAYESTQPAGALSRFTAVLASDNGEKHPTSPVQILPILQYGMTPFRPAYSSPHSVEVFNRTVDPGPIASNQGTPPAQYPNLKGPSLKDPALTRSLCYLAMVGAEPAALRDPSVETATLQAPVPTQVFLDKERVQESFSIGSSSTAYQVWSLTYSADGRLLTVEEKESPVGAAPAILSAGAAPATSAPAAPFAASSAVASSVSASAVSAAPPVIVHRASSTREPVQTAPSRRNAAPPPAATALPPSPPMRFIPDANMPMPPSRVLPAPASNPHPSDG